MSMPKPDDSDYQDEETSARLELLSAYTMHGRLERDGLVPAAVGATAEEAATVVEPPAGEDGYYYKAPSEKTWKAA